MTRPRPLAERARDCLWWSDELLRLMTERRQELQAQGLSRQEAAARAFAELEQAAKAQAAEGRAA